MRIISGIAKGRVVESPSGKNTRPTGSVVREAVFGILGGRVAGAEVLDLFCGSGAMAFEALSRGAGRAVLVDIDSRAFSAARRNAVNLGFKNCNVYRNDYLKALDILGKKGSRFDIVILDPPYAELAYYKKAIDRLKQHRLLAPDGVVVCEHNKTDSISATGYKTIKHSVYGNKAISILTEDNT